ncbi:MAG: FtsX-like permease family protein [Firmicutes bacterium]|nr:FtsX-like permease family protein [Bacillota bacterium]
MNLGENIRLAWEGLKANKMRALLTMLGIIIGISSVIGILTVGSGLSGSVTGSLSSLGAGNITIALQEREDEHPAMGPFGSLHNIDPTNLITDEMIGALSDRFGDAIVGVSLAEDAGSGQAKLEGRYANVSLVGVNTGYLDVNTIKLVKGRGFFNRDIEGMRNGVLVSDKLVNNLFGGDAASALGQELIVYLDDEILAFNIIGVYEYEVSPVMGLTTSSERDIYTSLYLPVTTAKKLGGAESGYTSFTITAAGSTDSIALATQAEDFMNRYYANNPDYRVTAMSMESLLESVNAVMGAISIALSLIAGISLVVGGIGVMNIMLVSVTERTREIGTRKALGATNSNIRGQFIVESMIICLIGGVIGIIFGAILGYIGSLLVGMVALPSLSSIALSVGFSLAIGIFFGYYPANKAALLDPIEALRYE